MLPRLEDMEHEVQHCQVLLQQMYQLYQHGLLTDVVLVIEGDRFSTHACILVAYSLYFKKVVLENRTAKVTEIVIENTTAAVLACLLEYLYTGELQLTRESVGPIQRLAEQLVIPGAVHQCELFNGNHVARSVDEASCLSVSSSPVVKSFKAEGDSKVQKWETSKLDVQPDSETLDENPGQSVQPALVELVSDRLFSLRKRKPSKLTEEVTTDTPRGKKKKQMAAPKGGKKSQSTKAPQCDLGITAAETINSGARNCSINVKLKGHESNRRRKQRVLKSMQGAQNAKGMKAHRLNGLESWMPGKIIEKVQNGEGADGAIYKCMQCNGKELHGQLAVKDHLQSHEEIGDDLEVQVRREKPALKGKQSEGGAKSRNVRRQRSESSQMQVTLTNKWNGLDTSIPDCIQKTEDCKGSGDATFRCTECDGKELRGHLAVRVHLQAHGDPKEESEIAHRCRHCGRTFRDLRTYESHLYKHGLNKEDRTLEDTDPEKLPLFNSRLYGPTRNEVAYECQECGCMYAGLSDLKSHIRQQHPDVTYSCPHCLVVHIVKFTHERHIMLKHATRHHICDICGQGFVRRTSVVRHKHSKHSIAEPSLEMFHCTEPGCTFIGYTPSMLSKHVQVHTGNTPGHVCETCGKTFSQRGALSTHIRVIHEKQRLYSCLHCPEKMTDKGALRNHMASEHGIKPLKCQHCSYSTHDNKQLTNHRYSLHGIKPEGENVQILRCDQCDYTCLDAARMRYHAVVHDTSHTFHCPYGDCQKAFPSKRRLQNHMNFQHGTKQFKCSYCPYMSPQSHKIKLHMRLVHTHVGYKPYQCPYCDFTCATGGNCRKHVVGRHPGQEVRYIKTGDSLPEELKNMKFKVPKKDERMMDSAIGPSVGLVTML